MCRTGYIDIFIWTCIFIFILINISISISISISIYAYIYICNLIYTLSSIFIFLHPHPSAPIRPCAQATEYTCSIDVWSYACVLAELLLGGPIFRGESNADQLLERA